MPKAGEDVDLVRLELLAGAAAVTLPATLEVVGDRGGVQPEPGREAGQDRNEGGAVRFARGGELEGHSVKPSAARITPTGAGTPVQSSNAATPWASSTSSPLTTLAPAARAATAVAVSG